MNHVGFALFRLAAVLRTVEEAGEGNGGLRRGSPTRLNLRATDPGSHEGQPVCDTLPKEHIFLSSLLRSKMLIRHGNDFSIIIDNDLTRLDEIGL